MRTPISIAVAVLCGLLALPASAITRSWTGTVSSAWSEPANWSPAGVPTSSDSLVFPGGVLDLVNDLPPWTVVGPMTFNGGVNLTGNPLVLSGDVTFTHQYSYGFSWHFDVKLENSITISAYTSYLFGSLDVNGKTLTLDGVVFTFDGLDGSGTVNNLDGLSIENGGSFTGQINGGSLRIGGSMPGADFNGILSGNGTVGAVTARALHPGNKSPCCGDSHFIGTLHTGSLDVAPPPASGGLLATSIDLVAGGVSDSFLVHGSVSLSGALNLTLLAGPPSPGEHFVLIDNDGTDAVQGTFAGLPEGANVSVGGYLFRLTYAGGDGNDVELIFATESSAAASQNAPSSVVGESVTFSAAVTAGGGVPAGTVTFYADGNALGSASLVNGLASIITPSLGIGDHSVTVAYSGGGAYFPSTSTPLIHTVAKGATATTFSAEDRVYGSTEIHITTTLHAPAAGTVAGTVTLHEGDQAIGSGSLSNGAATVSAKLLKPGVHMLTASYGGSASFLGSDSAAVAIEVAPAAAKLDVFGDGTPAADGTVVLNALVFALMDLPEAPSGMLTISERGIVLAQQAIDGSAAVKLQLASGHHALDVSYSGDDNFLAAATRFEVEVGGPASSRRRGVRH